MIFAYRRVVRFRDTDAAGVVYFANVLSICHEAYEASLAAAGVDLRSFFSGETGGETGEGTIGAIAVPIVHASVDLRSPMFVGEEYEISVSPTQLDPSKFEIRYEVGRAGLSDVPKSQALTVHLAINPQTRRRTELPASLDQWIRQLASTQNSIKP